MLPTLNPLIIDPEVFLQVQPGNECEELVRLLPEAMQYLPLGRDARGALRMHYANTYAQPRLPALSRTFLKWLLSYFDDQTLPIDEQEGQYLAIHVRATFDGRCVLGNARCREQVSSGTAVQLVKGCMNDGLWYPFDADSLRRYLAGRDFCERDTLEFKHPNHTQDPNSAKLTESIILAAWEEVCGMLNGWGGRVIIGIHEIEEHKGKIIGFLPSYKRRGKVTPLIGSDGIEQMVCDDAFCRVIQPQPLPEKAVLVHAFSVAPNRYVVVFAVNAHDKMTRGDRKQVEFTYTYKHPEPEHGRVGTKVVHRIGTRLERSDPS